MLYFLRVNANQNIYWKEKTGTKKYLELPLSNQNNNYTTTTINTTTTTTTTTSNNNNNNNTFSEAILRQYQTPMMVPNTKHLYIFQQ